MEKTKIPVQYQEFCNRLGSFCRAKRKIADFSLKRLSKITGINVGTLQKFETGFCALTSPRLFHIFEVLAINFTELEILHLQGVAKLIKNMGEEN